eukprot:gnl/Trimastix_PCT/3805.p1 GENE.gnl/Trimastix_PCT/3805~~gnl/Trimastix_PCT/3805.p1  ORF type:complete len:789 (+),score=139.78 gnl/Trimastix_PCT/3805:87-2453(+)
MSINDRLHRRDPSSQQKMSISDQVLNVMKPARVFRGSANAPFNSVDFTDDGDFVVTSGDDNAIRVYNAQTGAPSGAFNSQKYGAGLVRTTHANDYVLLASRTHGEWDHAVRYLGLRDNSFQRYFKGHRARVTGLAMSPQDDRFLSASLDGTVRLWDLGLDQAQGLLRTEGDIAPVVAFDPQGLVFGATTGGNINLYDLRTFHKGPFATFHVAYEEPASMHFSPDGKHLALATVEGTVQILDAYTGDPRASFSVGAFHGAGPDICWSPDARYVLTGKSDRGIAVYSLEAQEIAATWTGHPSIPLMVRWNPRKMMVASACSVLAFWIPDMKHLPSNHTHPHAHAQAQAQAQAQVQPMHKTKHKHARCSMNPSKSGKHRLSMRPAPHTTDGELDLADLPQITPWPPCFISIGEALFDIFPSGESKIGGAPFNVCAHASQMGFETHIVTRIGTDDLGLTLIREAKIMGVGCMYIQRDPTYATGTVQVTLDEHSEPHYEIKADAAWDHLTNEDDRWSHLLNRCSALCFGTLAQRCELSRATIQSFVQRAENAIRLYDINLRPGCAHLISAIQTSLHLANCLKINEDELVTLFNMLDIAICPETEPGVACNELIQRFQLDWVALTRGPRGTVVYTSDVEAFEGGPVPIDPTETGGTPVGAGDSTAAALVAGRLLNWSWMDTVNYANQVGAYVASQSGACPQLPIDLISRLRASLSTGKPRCDALARSIVTEEEQNRAAIEEWRRKKEEREAAEKEERERLLRMGNMILYQDLTFEEKRIQAEEMRRKEEEEEEA